MDKYKDLLNIFSDVLKNSEDYHIAYVNQVGYVALIGLLNKEDNRSLSVSIIIDEVFFSPEKMAESLLYNWRWQWLYENRALLTTKDYDDICKLDETVPDALRERYYQEISVLQNKIRAVLQKEN